MGMPQTVDAENEGYADGLSRFRNGWRLHSRMTLGADSAECVDSHPAAAVRALLAAGKTLRSRNAELRSSIGRKRLLFPSAHLKRER